MCDGGHTEDSGRVPPAFTRRQVLQGGVAICVVNGSGAVVAFGQPVWLLHEAPATGIPAARLPAPPPPVSGP